MRRSPPNLVKRRDRLEQAVRRAQQRRQTSRFWRLHHELLVVEFELFDRNFYGGLLL